MANELDNILFGNQQATQARQGSDLDQILFGQQAEVAAPTTDALALPEQTKSSPLTLLERMRLSFADDAGRRAFLKKKFSLVEQLENGKFAVGDNPNELLPIDPEGVLNDVIGDLGDVVGEIPVIAGQIIGAGAGGTVGSTVPGAGTTAGIVTGGAAGSGAGEAVRIAIGKALGVREQKAVEDATDIAIATAFGGAGEALAVGTQMLGRGAKRIVSRKLTKALEKAVQTEGAVPGSVPRKVTIIGKVLKFLANVPEESTETVFRHGVEKTLGNPNNFKKGAVVDVVNTTVRALDEVTTRLGKDVGEGVRLLEKAARAQGKASRMPVDDLFPSLKKAMQDQGFLDDFGRIVKDKTPLETKDLKPLLSMLKIFGKVDPKTGVFSRAPGRTVSIREAVKTSRLFGNKFEKLTPQGQRILGESLDLFRDRLTKSASALGVDDFARANQAYQELLNVKGALKQLDPTNLPRMEKFVKALENQGQFTKQNLRLLQQKTKIPFLDKWEMWNAAQDFVGASPNLLRMGMIASTLGVATGLDTKEEKALTIGGAFALGTPAGARVILRGLAKAGGVPRSAVGAARKTMDTKTAAALITQLLKARTKPGLRASE